MKASASNFPSASCHMDVSIWWFPVCCAVVCLPRELWVKGNIAHQVRQCQEVKCEKNARMLSTSPVYSIYHVQDTQYGSRLAVRWEGDFRVIKILRQ